MHKNAAKIQILTVFLGGQVFGIPTHSIQDVIRPVQMTQVPLAPEHIKGVSNLRGRIMTVIDLRERINEKPADTQKSMNVVVEQKGEIYSILVDRVGDVIDIEDSKIEPPPESLNAMWRNVLDGVYQADQKLILILNAVNVIESA